MGIEFTSWTRVIVAGLLVLLLSPRDGSADAVESDTSAGKDTFIEDLNAHGTFGHPDKKKQTAYTWNAGFTSTRATSVDTTTGSTVTDVTRDGSGGFGLQTPKHFAADFGFDYASTPDERLVQHGPNIGVGYTYFFAQQNNSQAQVKSEDLESPFHPDIGARLSLASVDYVQTFGSGFIGRRAGVLRPATGENTITQGAPTLSITGDPLKWLSLKIAFTSYTYNKDPNKFLAYLDSTRVLRNRTTGLSSIVNGLPRNETLLQAIFDLSEDWSFQFSEIVARSVVDGSRAFTTRLIFFKDLGEAWNLGLGLENDKSEDVKDNLLLINVKYIF